MAEEKPKQRRRRPKLITPLMVAEGAAYGTTESTRVRRNITSQIESVNRFANIDNGLIPFKNSSSISSGSSINVRDAVVLCQKAYYNFSTFRNVVDLMTEFSTSDIYFKGGSKKSRDFFRAFFKKINLRLFQDKFFREYYRSGNVFIYRFEAKLRAGDVKKIIQVYADDTAILEYGLTDTRPAKPTKIGDIPGVKKNVIPTKYMILNPADVHMEGSASFSSGNYAKAITDYELERIKHPYTEEDKQIYESLDPATKKKINQGKMGQVLLPLNPDKLIVSFYRKQDYEPFAVPMGFPVLDDINLKAEMKKMDAAILRTMQQCILLVTMGAEPDKGGINQKNLGAMQRLFENESVGRVLISDYTTKAEFVTPKVADLLDPKKYDVVERDINTGLNNILFSGETFSNQASKVDVFVARLEHGREMFLHDFLIPEMKRISRALGFKSYPEPVFDKITLKDSYNTARVVNRLIELNVLTPEEGLEAHESGRWPDIDSSIKSQRKFKAFKDEGLYEPLVGGTPSVEEAGRPEDTGTPQQTKEISPQGEGPQSKNELGEKQVAMAEFFDLTSVKNNFILAQNLEKEVLKQLRSKHNIKKLSKKQKEVASDIVDLIVTNEDSKHWVSKVEEYCENPSVKTNNKILGEITEICDRHQVDKYLAGILRSSIPNDKD
jgi:hypothetical protein